METKNGKTEPKLLVGFADYLPDKQVKFNALKKLIEQAYRSFGFLPLEMPTLYDTDVLLAKSAGGETANQVYQFTKGDTDISMRFDLTVPLAIYVAMHDGEISYPFSRYHIGEVYRGEKKQKGRYRGFYQCDVDIIEEDGKLNLLHDAQIPAIIYKTFTDINIGAFTIKINNRKIPNGMLYSIGISEKLAAAILGVVDKIEKIGITAVENELKILELKDERLDEGQIAAIIEFISISGTTDEKLAQLRARKIASETYWTGVKELEDVVRYMRMFGVPDDSFIVELTVARGLSYYTGTVYETFLNEHKKIGSVCSGGRFDNLAGLYTEKNLPGVGISIGLTRLFYQLDELNILPELESSVAKAMVAPMTEDIAQAIAVGNDLRAAGINTEVYLSDRRMKAMFKHADKLNIPYVIVIGDDEIASGTVTLKIMATGEQKQKITIVEAIEIINTL